MSRFILLTVISIIALSSKMQSQDFDALTSQIFFSIDIKKHDTTLISEFSVRPELILKKDIGWTVYPPTDNKGDPIPFYIFSFAKHPYFSLDDNSGRVMVMINKEHDRIIGMSLSFALKSVQAFDSTYKSITELYAKYALKIIKRPNMSKPFEVTKYLSKGGSDYVIITKGESDNKPYIHIAYNYQGYTW